MSLTRTSQFLPSKVLGVNWIPRSSAPFLGGVEVGLGDQLEAIGDEAVVDPALALQLGLVLVLLGEGVLHLLEAVVVQPGGVDVGADNLGPARLGQPDRHLRGGDRVIGVVERQIKLAVHLPTGWSPDGRGCRRC